MVASIVKDFSYGMSREKPHTRIGKASGFKNSLEQRRNMVTEPEAVAV